MVPVFLCGDQAQCTDGHTKQSAASIIYDLHSQRNMRAFFSQTDNVDEQGARLYGVMGRLDSEPEMRLRVGVYGYWLPLRLTAVFTNNGSFKEVV